MNMYNNVSYSKTKIEAAKMTKRPCMTAEEVLEVVLSDDDELDDPDEPMMEGSDDEFSDLEVDSDDEYDPGDMHHSYEDPIQPVHSTSHGSPPPLGLLVK